MASSLKRIPSIIFKSLLGLVIVSGLVVIYCGVKTGLDFVNTFFYFTIQSNLILLGVTIFGIIQLVRQKPEGSVFRMIRISSVLWILITGLVYHFMLSAASVRNGTFSYSSVALHYIAPIFAILNWLIFEDKGKNSFTFVICQMAYPLVYVGISELRLLIDEFVPYWFLNPRQPLPDGTGSVGVMLAIVAGLVLFFGGLGAFIIFLDRLMGKRKTKNVTTPEAQGQAP